MSIALFIYLSIYRLFPVVIFFCLFFVFLGLHPRHVEVPRLGVAYATATAIPESNMPTSVLRESINLPSSIDLISIPLWSIFRNLEICRIVTAVTWVTTMAQLQVRETPHATDVAKKKANKQKF